MLYEVITDGLGRTFGNAGAATMAFSRVDLRVSVCIDERNIERTRTDTDQTCRTFIFVDSGNSGSKVT